MVIENCSSDSDEEFMDMWVVGIVVDNNMVVVLFIIMDWCDMNMIIMLED